jgi:GntR family transcriptional regulator
MIHLDYRDGRPIYCQIAEGFRQQIQSGVLKAGDRIPSVRELAAELVINPNTIQRAYRELEGQGWIVTVTGKGCFVTEGLQADNSLLTQLDALTQALIEQGISRQELAERILRGGESHA